MNPGWSHVAPPLFPSREPVSDLASLRIALLNEAEQSTPRARVCEAAVEDTQRAAAYGVISVSGEIVLDVEEPAFAAIMVVCRVPVAESCCDLLSDWARVAEMPHRERDVFHFPVVPPTETTSPEICEITRRRQAEYERIFTDGGLVGCVSYAGSSVSAA